MPELNFMIEDARIIFRNFGGKEGQYNREGDRNFAVVLDAATADQMASDGWNVKYLKAREEGEEDTPYIPVEVKYKVRPPRVTLVTSGGRTPLGEKEIEMLDYADIKMVDLFCNGYNWVVGDKSGIKAYLQTMFVTINEDPLERKYGVYGSSQPDPEDED